MTGLVVSDRHPAVTFGEIVYAPGSDYGPRIQHSVQLVVVHTGLICVRVDGVPRTAGAMTASVLLPGHEERFVFAATQPTHHSWIHFWDLGPTSPLTARLAPLVDPIPLSRTLSAQIRGLLDLSASRLPTRTEIETLIARQALYQFIGEAELGRTGDTASDPVRRALHAIDDALSTGVDLDRVAAAAAVSRSHLVRLFRREVGQTPSAYVWDRRVERGVQLLEETGLPVDEVARRCGFRTTQHFSRRVKAATGTSPAAVRRRAWSTAGPPSAPRRGDQAADGQGAVGNDAVAGSLS